MTAVRKLAFLTQDSHPPLLKRFYLFLERGREGERERNINVLEMHRSVAFCMVPTGALAHNPGMCPDWELNR